MAKSELHPQSVGSKKDFTDVECVLRGARTRARALMLFQEAFPKRDEIQNEVLVFLISELADRIDQATTLVTGKPMRT